MDIVIRRIMGQDIRKAAEIWNYVVKEGRAFPQTDCLTEETGKAFFAEQTYTGVAEDKESRTIVGMYILHPNNVGRCGHICNASYAVDYASRGRHIGEALVLDCMVQAKAAGFRILQFNAVVRSNDSALSLYRKLGFIRLGVIPGGFMNRDGVYEDIIPHYITL